MFLSNRSQRVLVDISSCPKIFVGSPRDLVSLPFKVYMNSPGGIMRHHFILGHPKGWHPASEISSWTSSLRTSVLAFTLSEICFWLILSWLRLSHYMAKTVLNVLLDQLAVTHLLSLSEQQLPLGPLLSLYTDMLENRHQSILSILAFAHRHSPGMTWSRGSGG